MSGVGGKIAYFAKIHRFLHFLKPGVQKPKNQSNPIESGLKFSPAWQTRTENQLFSKIFSAGGNFILTTYLSYTTPPPSLSLPPPASRAELGPDTLSDHLRPHSRFFALPGSLLIKGPPAKRGGTGSTPAAQHFFEPPFLP